MALADVSDRDIIDAVGRLGSQRKAAEHFGVAISTFVEAIRRRGIELPPTPGAPGTRDIPSERPRSARRRSLPTITRESLHAALVPPNLCQVRKFLDDLDDESREVVEEALGYSPQDLSAKGLRTWLVGLGFKEEDVPSNGAITDHRNGRRPCRCSG